MYQRSSIAAQSQRHPLPVNVPLSTGRRVISAVNRNGKQVL